MMHDHREIRRDIEKLAELIEIRMGVYTGGTIAEEEFRAGVVRALSLICDALEANA